MSNYFERLSKTVELKRTLPIFTRSGLKNIQTRFLTTEFNFSAADTNIGNLLKWTLDRELVPALDADGNKTQFNRDSALTPPSFLFIESVRVLKTDNSSIMPWDVSMGFLSSHRYIGSSLPISSYRIEKSPPAVPITLYELGDHLSTVEDQQVTFACVEGLVAQEPFSLIMTPAIMDSFVLPSQKVSNEYFLPKAIFENYVKICGAPIDERQIVNENDFVFYRIERNDCNAFMAKIKSAAAIINENMMTFSSAQRVLDGIQNTLYTINKDWTLPQFSRDFETTIRPTVPYGVTSTPMSTESAIMDAIRSRLVTQSDEPDSMAKIAYNVRMSLSMTLVVTYLFSREPTGGL